MATDPAAAAVTSGGEGSLVVEVSWVVNPFRGDRFAELWAPAAEAALRYGAKGYALFRSQNDRLHFTQLAFFDAKLDWERYWYSEEMAQARAEAAGLYNVPVLPEYHYVVSSGALPSAEGSSPAAATG